MVHDIAPLAMAHDLAKPINFYSNILETDINVKRMFCNGHVTWRGISLIDLGDAPHKV